MNKRRKQTATSVFAAPGRNHAFPPVYFHPDSESAFFVASVCLCWSCFQRAPRMDRSQSIKSVKSAVQFLCLQFAALRHYVSFCIPIRFMELGQDVPQESGPFTILNSPPFQSGHPNSKNDGVLECWSNGQMVKFSHPSLHHSATPPLHHPAFSPRLREPVALARQNAGRD